MSKRVFVGNLVHEVTNEDLTSLFAPYGEVLMAEVVIGRRGRARGFGYVELASDESAARAVEELNGQDVKGQRLTVAEARSRGPSSPGAGRDSWP